MSDTADVDYPVYQYLATDAHASQKWYFFEVQGATETMYGEASYDDSGSLLAQQTSASGGTTTYNYNGNAYQLTSKITDPNGGSTHYQYYTMGQTKKVICGSTNVKTGDGSLSWQTKTRNRPLSLRGLSVRQLQGFFGFEEPRAIYKWQKGESLPTVDNLYALGKILDVPMEQILIPVNNKEQQASVCCSSFLSQNGYSSDILYEL